MAFIAEMVIFRIPSRCWGYHLSWWEWDSCGIRKHGKPTQPRHDPIRAGESEEKMFESEFDYTLERENMEKVRKNVEKRWGDRWALGKMSMNP